MKTIIKLFCMLVCGFAATACSDSVGIPDAGPVGNPEKEILGTYTGVWTRTLNDDVVTAPGTITISNADKRYVAEVNAKCDDFKFDLTAAANVVNYSEGYYFYNQSATSGFALPDKDPKLGDSPFNGRVVNGKATIKFTLTQKEGRKQFNYVYEFVTE